MAIELTVIVQVLPVETVVVPVEAPFLYKVIVALEGLDTSRRFQVPVTAILDPLVMGELIVGGGVQEGLIPDPPDPISVRLNGACALITVCQAVEAFG